MRITADYIKDKKNRYHDQVRFHLGQFHRPPQERLKLYFMDVPAELAEAEENLFLMDGEVYPEDYATFQLVVRALETVASAQSLDDAHYVVLPVNLYFYRHLKNDIDTLITETRRVAGDKTFLFFFISDFCLRPITRSVPTERMLLADIAGNPAYFPSFITSRDRIIHFESTLDLLGDVAIFPLIPGAPSSPEGLDRQYLFSFVGEYHKEGWPEGLIRSPSQKDIWDSLAERNGDRVFIGSGNAITDSSGEEFRTIPRQSLFTLCPRGIACWSFRLFEAIVSGSIPVILSDSYIKPFSEFIPWDEFSITISEGRLNEVDELLTAIRPEVVTFLQQNLKRNQNYFTLDGLCSLLEEKLLHLAQTQINEITRKPIASAQ